MVTFCYIEFLFAHYFTFSCDIRFTWQPVAELAHPARLSAGASEGDGVDAAAAEPAGEGSAGDPLSGAASRGASLFVEVEAREQELDLLEDGTENMPRGATSVLNNSLASSVGGAHGKRGGRAITNLKGLKPAADPAAPSSYQLVSRMAIKSVTPPNFDDAVVGSSSLARKTGARAAAKQAAEAGEGTGGENGPKLGVGVVSFSCDSRYVATRNDNMPHGEFLQETLFSLSYACQPLCSLFRRLAIHHVTMLCMYSP